MAEIHEAILVACRRRLLRNGFKETKSPMPTFRPDIFAQKQSRDGKIVRELAVEAEIPSTLFSPHTSHQLSLMNDYVLHQRRKDIRVDAYLLVPKGKRNVAQADSLLDSLFPASHLIRVLTM